LTAVFADTFYWAALTTVGDPAYARAIEISRAPVPERIITTDEVLTEYLTFFAGAKESIRERVGRNVVDLMHGSGVRIVPQSRESFLAGLELYRARPDKGYSLVDCISMQTMQREGLTDVLTNDRHFEQEGFRALFRV
jgi:predicted nucleic acid-binding protein